MDEALDWIRDALASRPELREVVGLRALERRRGGRQLAWREIGDQVGRSHTTAQAWYREGIELILTWLEAPGRVAGRGRAPTVTAATPRRLMKS